jgi:hypothetical protein
MALVDALKKENYEVTYTCNKVKKSGSLEVYLEKNGKKVLIFSKIQSGYWLDDDQVANTVEFIQNLD